MIKKYGKEIIIFSIVTVSIIINVVSYLKALELKEVNSILEQKNIEIMMEDHNHEHEQDNDEKVVIQRVVDYSNGLLRFVESNEEDIYQTMTLVGYDTKFYDSEYEVVDYSEDKVANVKLKVFGTLYNLRISNIKWDEDYKTFNEFEEVDSVFNIEEVTNTDVLFNSVLAEGIPNEAIIWEDDKGNEYRYLISYDGYGFANRVLICEEYEN